MEQLSSTSALSVTRRESELVVPATSTPREVKYLSDIDDQGCLRFHTYILMFYKNNPSMEGIDPAKVIKDALSKTLVFYYPLAGRLIEGPNGKLMVNCNGEGILFTEACADVELEMLGDSIKPPCPFLEDLLYNVPGSDGIIDCPLMLIQVRMSSLVTARERFESLKIPHGYYGNAFSFSAVVSKAGHVGTYPLTYALELIKKAKNQANEEYLDRWQIL